MDHSSNNIIDYGDVKLISGKTRQSALQNTAGNSTLRRSATSSQVLRCGEEGVNQNKISVQLIKSSSGRINNSRKGGEKNRVHCQNNHPLLQATLDRPKSARSRCFACPKTDRQGATSRRSKSNRSSTGKIYYTANGSSSQLTRLK